MADSPNGKTKSKDMYWFAHGGEPLSDKSHQQRNDGDEEVGSPEQHNSPSWKPLQERKALPEEARNVSVGKECAATVLVGGADNSALLSHMERDDRVAVALDSYGSDTRMSGSSVRVTKNAEVEKSKKISEAEQDNRETRAKKKLEREAALEARRNAQRSNVSFAFGSSLPRNLDLDVTTVYQGSDLDRNKRQSTQAPISSQKSGPVIAPKVKKEGWSDMHKSLFATFENTQSDKIFSWTPVNQPQNCLVGSGAFVADDKMSQSMISPMSACRGRRKTDLTPTVPYDRTAPPRTPVTPASSGKRSVSMTRLDQLARPRRTYVEAQRDHAKANSTSSTSSVQKDIQNSPSRPRSSASEHSAGSNRPSTTPPVNMRARTASRKPRPVSIAGTMPDRKPTVEFKKDLSVHRTPEKKNEAPTTKRASTANKAKSPAPKNVYIDKPGQKTPIKHLTPKSSPVRKLPTRTKKSVAATAALSHSLEPVNSSVEETLKVTASPPESPTGDEENSWTNPESGSKRIISEEEAKAALAEKRRLAREQAEKEAELERQRQEEQRRQEEERIHMEEEEQRKMEEEQLHLLEEHRKHEEEKLRKAIEEQERKEHEEKLRREEDARLKSEQERKAKEEAERQRIELEEKLRKEEEERAERKKRLEKIMSRTRGKGTSSTGSHSGGDQSDSADSQAGEAAEALSGNSSLNSVQSTDPSSGSASLEIHPESFHGSENESLNSMDMMALSENSSLDSNLLMLPSDGAVSVDSDQASTLSNQNICDKKVESDVRNQSSDLSASTDLSAEPNMLFSASGDNPSSYSSETETINTETTVLPTGERISNFPPVETEIEHNLDSASDKLLDFGVDSVQTLVSQAENGICSDSRDSVSDQLVVENFAVDTSSHDTLMQPAVLDSEHFADKSEFNMPLVSQQEICVPETQEFVGDRDFAANPFAGASEMLIAEVASSEHNEVQDTHETIIDLGTHKDVTPSEKELNVGSSELCSSAPMVFSENIYLDEESYSHSDLVKTSVLTTSKFSEENLPPSPVPPEKNFNIPFQEDVNSPNKIFAGNSEQYVESSDASQSLSSPNKIFDGNSEQYVENTDASQSLSSPNKIFDGSSEQFVENVNMSQSFNFTGTLFDGNSEQYLKSVDMSESLNFVVSPSAERKSVTSGDNSIFPKEISSDLVKMDSSVTSIEDLEPSTIQTRVTLSDEHFVSASVTDSEDSSLDSNLSQVMNVNTVHHTTSQEIDALNSSPLDIARELSGKTSTFDLDASCMHFQKMPQYITNDYAPTTNGYQRHVTESFACDNGIDGDYKTSHMTEDHPVSSLIDNEINSNVISPINNHHVENILNTGDINFNKVPSNPFLPTDDTTEGSENQFLNQEAVQTEFHV